MTTYKVTARTIDGMTFELPNVSAETPTEALNAVSENYHDGFTLTYEDSAVKVSHGAIIGYMVDEIKEPSRIQLLS